MENSTGERMGPSKKTEEEGRGVGRAIPLPWEMSKMKVLEMQRCPRQGSLMPFCEEMLMMDQALGRGTSVAHP